LPISLPDTHGTAALALTVFALFLFSRDRIPLETSSMIILATLVLIFELFPYSRGGEFIEAKASGSATRP
jgi:hypothetical protein